MRLKRRFFRLSLVPDEEPAVQRVPYATIEYQLDEMSANEKTRTIQFNVEYAVPMDHAIYAVKVSLNN